MVPVPYRTIKNIITFVRYQYLYFISYSLWRRIIFTKSLDVRGLWIRYHDSSKYLNEKIKLCTNKSVRLQYFAKSIAYKKGTVTLQLNFDTVVVLFITVRYRICYCIVLYCTVLYCTLLYFTVRYGTLPYCSITIY